MWLSRHCVKRGATSAVTCVTSPPGSLQRLDAEQLVAQLLELLAVERLGEDVCDVEARGHVLDVDDRVLHELADLETRLSMCLVRSLEM